MTFVSFDSVTVGAPDFTQLNLGFGLCDALTRADVSVLPPSVIEIQSNWVRVVPAVCAAALDLVVIQPALQRFRSLLRLCVQALSITRLRDSGIAPCSATGRVVLSRMSSALATSVRAVLSGVSLGREHCVADDASAVNKRYVHPRRHACMLASCKPDVFEATYVSAREEKST